MYETVADRRGETKLVRRRRVGGSYAMAIPLEDISKVNKTSETKG